MLVLFDYGSALFLNGMYDEAITVFDKILNEVNSSSERSQIFISVFYPNWLIIRKFYLNLSVNFNTQAYKESCREAYVL